MARSSWPSSRAAPRRSSAASCAAASSGSTRASTCRAFGCGLRHGVDYVALSFVRSAGDLRHARRVLRRLGGSVPLIAKLEKAEAIDNLDAIIAEADGVMVARGDLGVEMAPEQVPLLQKRIIRRANERGIPVITATQMLESMVH